MLRLHFIDTDEFVFGPELRARVADIAEGSYRECRELLKPLSGIMNVSVMADIHTIPETGELGRTRNKNLVEYLVHPEYEIEIEEIIEHHFRATLFHEFHHAARTVSQSWGGTFLADGIYEGLGGVFERDYGGRTSPWVDYSGVEIRSWVEELKGKDRGNAKKFEWFYDHSDGRRWIAYRAGAFIVDEALKHNPCETSATLVDRPADEILKMAGLDS